MDALNLTQNTLVVLTSDNGPTDWPPGSVGPFRGRKWSLYEGGIREPFLTRWPEHIPAGMVDTTTTIDLFRTFCNLTKVEAPTVDFDGEDMSQALLGKPQNRDRPLFWEYFTCRRPTRSSRTPIWPSATANGSC